jgi:excisionase family DNA binding protein
MGEDLLTRKAAAAELGVCLETIGRKIRTGELPAYTIGSDRRRRYVRRDDVARLTVPTLTTPTRRPQAATSATTS